MKLLYWTQQFHPSIGGVEVMTAGALPRLQSRGYECSVITSSGSLDAGREEIYRSAPVYRLPFRGAIESHNPARMAELMREVAELKRRLVPDVVHLFVSDPSGLFHLLTQSAHPSKLVVSVHNFGFDGQSGKDSLLGRLVGSADWVAGPSAFVVEGLRSRVPDCVARSSVIPSGVVPPDLRPSPFSVSPPHLTCVGRLVREKGFDLLVEAMPGLRSRFPEIQLQLVGDGPARSQLEALVDDLGLREQIRFRGWVSPSQIPSILDRTSLVVVPSRRETMSQVAIQGAFLERPVVATRVGGIPDVVVEGTTGLLVTRNDPAALGQAIETLLASPERAREMGLQARAYVESRFSMDRYVDTMDELYRSLTL